MSRPKDLCPVCGYPLSSSAQIWDGQTWDEQVANQHLIWHQLELLAPKLTSGGEDEQ